jgi:hypothetical protein
MPGFNSETWGRFCDRLGYSIVVQYSVGPIDTLRGRIAARELGNQIQTLFPNNDALFQDDNASFTQMKLFNHGLKNIKVNFNIFPGQHNHQI